MTILRILIILNSSKIKTDDTMNYDNDRNHDKLNINLDINQK